MGPIIPKNAINTIFKVRDRTVSSKDKKLFLSTQTKGREIKGSYSKGYLKLSRLKSKVLYIHRDDKNRAQWIALIHEAYYKKI